jgi:hypothetical protein
MDEVDGVDGDDLGCGHLMETRKQKAKSRK